MLDPPWLGKTNYIMGILSLMYYHDLTCGRSQGAMTNAPIPLVCARMVGWPLCNLIRLFPKDTPHQRCIVCSHCSAVVFYSLLSPRAHSMSPWKTGGDVAGFQIQAIIGLQCHCFHQCAVTCTHPPNLNSRLGGATIKVRQ